MKAFIVRPFGRKKASTRTNDKLGEFEIDFNKVERLLIKPALKELNIAGSTTEVIIEAGNIREDMFQQLLTADLVVADISFHNANVFYELGIRHALRDRHTFLIRASQSPDDAPFDIKTDRYFTYKVDKPGASKENLIRALRATIESERKDSPIYYMLRNIIPHDPELLQILPESFDWEVENRKSYPGDLAMLADEAGDMSWSISAQRRIGKLLFKCKAYELAVEVWERVLNWKPRDKEAHTLLSTLYQRLGRLNKSDISIHHLIERDDLTAPERAEAYALMGRNAKSKWLTHWDAIDNEESLDNEVLEQALNSVFLQEAFKAYEEGFSQDLNHYYSGINALGLLTILCELISQLPEVWEAQWQTAEEAKIQSGNLTSRLAILSVLVKAALEGESKRAQGKAVDPLWAEITEADLYFLTSEKPEFVASRYRALAPKIDDFALESIRRQLIIYNRLAVRKEMVRAVADVLDNRQLNTNEAAPHVILFSGHMLDRPDREEPRFPASKVSEAREGILTKMKEIQANHGGNLLGFAGGACGGDLIFHEICQFLGIQTHLYLSLPKIPYLKESVSFAGDEWRNLFLKVYAEHEVSDSIRVLSQAKELPQWVKKKKGYSIWQRTNVWMLYNAIALAERRENATLLGLWNGKQGDSGGTGDMMAKADAMGIDVVTVVI